MAGAAGFEPAVPGLGGRCIIQAMLHAHLAQAAPFKKASYRNAIFSPHQAMTSNTPSKSAERTTYGSANTLCRIRRRTIFDFISDGTKNIVERQMEGKMDKPHHEPSSSLYKIFACLCPSSIHHSRISIPRLSHPQYL